MNFIVFLILFFLSFVLSTLVNQGKVHEEGYVVFDTLNFNNPMNVSNTTCKPNHQISTMMLCGCYMFEFSVSKDMIRRKLTMIKGGFRLFFSIYV